MDVPPYIRRPIIRLAYCTGIRRCACSMKTTSAMITTPRARMPRNVAQPLASLICQPSVGSRAAIEVKIRTDMPLPTPRSVISSPSHMTTPVPAVIVMTSVIDGQRHAQLGVSGMIGKSLHWPWNSWPERASATNAEDCRIARPRVRYRVYCVILAWPDWPSFFSSLQPRDDHGEQLQDDAGRDVRHDAEREDRQLQQRAAGEEVQQREDAGRVRALQSRRCTSARCRRRHRGWAAWRRAGRRR